MSSRFDHLEFDSGSEEQAVVREEERDSSQHYEQLATTAFEHESFRDALKLFARILEFDRRNRHSWIGQVQCLIQLSRPQDALSWSSQALEEFPEDTELIALKATALARNGCWEEALALSDASLQPSTDNATAWLARAETLVIQNETVSTYCHDQAVGFETTSWQIPWLASRMRFFYQHHALALKMAETALDRAPTHSTPWLQKGRCQAALGLTKQAHHSLTRARELCPDSLVIDEAIQSLEKPSGIARVLSGLGFGKRNS